MRRRGRENQGGMRDGLVTAQGTTRARRYNLQTLLEETGSFACGGAKEDSVVRQVVLPAVDELPESVRWI